MTLSEWTQSIRAVREILLVAYTVHGINPTHRIAYRPPIAVSPYPLPLLVSYCKWALWCCGQPWPYVGMDSLGMRLHADGNTIGDAAKTSAQVSPTCTQNAILSLLIIPVILSHQIHGLLTIYCLFRLSPVLFRVAMSGITCVQLNMFSMLRTCNLTAAGAFLMCTYFETGSMLPLFSGIVVSTRANQY